MKNQANILLAKKLAMLEKRTNELVPEIYAAFCCVLFEKYHWDASQIADLFKDTQDKWTELVNNDEVDSMIRWCEELTGAELRNGDNNET